MASPTLVVVSGPAGSGKTTLAHEIARAIGCPAICRDEIKEGMVHANPGHTPTPTDPLSVKTFSTFFAVIDFLLGEGVTIVAEAAFQDKLWRPGLTGLTNLGEIRIIKCNVDVDLALERRQRRFAEDPLRRAAHGDQTTDGGGAMTEFVPVSLPVPSLLVDTTDGYDPGLKDILAFIDEGRRAQ